MREGILIELMLHIYMSLNLRYLSLCSRNVMTNPKSAFNAVRHAISRYYKNLSRVHDVRRTFRNAFPLLNQKHTLNAGSIRSCRIKKDRILSECNITRHGLFTRHYFLRDDITLKNH